MNNKNNTTDNYYHSKWIMYIVDCIQFNRSVNVNESDSRLVVYCIQSEFQALSVFVFGNLNPPRSFEYKYIKA